MLAIEGGRERTVVENTPPSRVMPKPLASANRITSMVSVWHTRLVVVRTDVAADTTDTVDRKKGRKKGKECYKEYTDTSTFAVYKKDNF